MALVDLAKGIFSQPDEHGENEMILRATLDSGLNEAIKKKPPSPSSVIYDVQKRIMEGSLARGFEEVRQFLAQNNVSPERIKDFDRIVDRWQKDNAEKINAAMQK